MVRHYSFDMWDTLIKPNPRFKQERMRYLHIYLLTRGHFVPGEKIEAMFKEVWTFFDAISRFNGKAPNPLEMYALVLFRLTGSVKGITPLDMEMLYQAIEVLFLDNPPALYDEDTKNVLDELKVRAKTMSILSNTSFIRGSTLDKVLDVYEIKNHFNFRLYSDQTGYSKPDKKCFQNVLDQLPYDANEIMHVGDDVMRDAIPANDCGMQHKVINSTQLTIKDLL